MSEQLKHDIEWEPGHDCIRFECKWDSPGCHPGKGGSHGMHGLSIRFLTTGKDGTVQFVLYTGLNPVLTDDKTEYCMIDAHPMPADLGCHSKAPLYEGQKPFTDDCEYTGGTCYYDGSSLNAYGPYAALVNAGIDALWAFLDGYYKHVFEDGEYPTPAAYPKPLRQKE